MKRLVLFALICSPIFGQTVLDDWNCGTATAVASPVGGPTTITCSAPHGFSNGQHILLTNATGKWAPMNTQWEVVLKYTMSSAGTTVYVNDTSQVDPTPGGVWMIYPETYYPQCGGAPENVTMVSVTDNRAMVVNRGPNPHGHCPEDKMWGPQSRPNSWTITTSGPKSNKFTIPLDSSAFGTFEGQTIRIIRGGSYPYEPQPYYYSSSADGSPVALSMGPNGYQQFTIDGCPDKTDAIRCSFAYGDPLNQKGYMDYQGVTGLVVSGGVGTISLSAPFTQHQTAATRKFQPGELFWLWSMNETDADLGTINRPWIISAIENNGQTIVVSGMGTAGVADGTYTPVSGSYKNFIFPILADFYTYLGSPGNVNLMGYPAGFVQSTVKQSGTPFNSSLNRYQVWMQWGNAMNQIPMEWGTYVYEQPSGLGYHGYHSIDLDTVPNEWEQEEFALCPQHMVGSGSGVPQGADPTYTGWVGYAPWTGEKNHYVDIWGASYMNLSSLFGAPGGQSGYVGPMTLDKAANEPDEWSPVRATRYNPTTSTYHINITAPQWPVAPMAANFYYSTTGDIRTIGIGASTAMGTSVAVSAANIGLMQWNFDSPAMPRQSHIWFAMRPLMTVTGLSGNGQSPIILSFDADPNMQVNDHVTIAGAGGNTNANCTNCQITKVYPRRFWFRMMPSSQAPTVGGPLINISSDGSVCTANLNVAPGLIPGWRIGVTGVPAGGPGNVGGSGGSSVSWFTVTGVSGKSFTFACPGTTAGIYNTDANPAIGIFMGIVVDPAVAIAGTGNADWDGNFTATMVSTENNKNFTEISFQPPAPPTPPAMLTGLSCTPNPIVAGSSSTCSVSLNQPVQSMTLTVGTSNPAALTVPSTLLVGGQNAQFVVTAQGGFTGKVTLRVHLGIWEMHIPIEINAGAARKPHATVSRQGSVAIPVGGVAAAVPQVSSVTCIPKIAHAGESVRCELRLNAPPAGSLSIKLVSSNTSLRSPSTVTMRAGQSSAVFYADAAPFARQESAILTATQGGAAVQERVLMLPSNAPVLSVPETQFVHPGETLRFAVNASDARDLPTRIAAAGLPGGASFDVNTNRLEWTPTASQTGSHEVRFTATNSAQASQTATVRIEVGSGKPVVTNIVNAASQSGSACSPGSLASLTGKWLTSGDAQVTRVHVGGESALVVSASATRIDFVCPRQAASSVSVETGTGASQPVPFATGKTAPGIFSVDGSGRGQGQIFLDASSLAAPRTSRQDGAPVLAGDVVSVRVTGVNRDIPTRIVVGNLDAEVTGILPMHNQAGILEIRARIPLGTPAGDQVPVWLEVQSEDGKPIRSNTVTMAIETLEP